MRNRILKVLPVLLLCMLFVLAPGVKTQAAPPLWIYNCNFNWLNPDPTYVYLDCYGNPGDAINPYVIKDEKDLAALSYFSNVIGYDFGGKYISFAPYNSVLDMAAFEWTPIGCAGTFYGNLIGNGVVIDNLNLGVMGTGQTYPTSGFIGIYKGEASKLYIKNFTIVNTPYDGNSAFMGGFAAIDYGWISCCEVQGSILVKGVPVKKAGGFIGDGSSQQGTDQSVADFSMEFYNSVNSNAYVGGFAGDCGGTIKDCQANWKLQMDDCNMNAIGGFIGYGCSNLDVYRCECNPDVTINNNNELQCLGGFVGYNKGYIRESSSKGTIDVQNSISAKYVGGFVGYNDGASCELCKDKMRIYVIGCKTATVGGFVGYADFSTLYGCSYGGPLLKVEIADYVGGFAGYMYKTTVNRANAFDTSISAANPWGISNMCVGGFAGSTDISKTVACYFNGRIYTDYRTNAGGFIGDCKDGTADSCYAVGNIYTGKDCNAGGFFGKSESMYVVASYASCNLDVQNNCNAGGAIGFAVNTNSIYNLYWNKEKTQTICGNTLPVMYNKAVGNGVYIGNIIGWSDSLMRSSVFVATLNGSQGSITNWSITPNINGGYPVF